MQILKATAESQYILMHQQNFTVLGNDFDSIVLWKDDHVKIFSFLQNIYKLG